MAKKKALFPFPGITPRGPVGRILKPSVLLRKAAEMINAEVYDKSIHVSNRDGCCHALQTAAHTLRHEYANNADCVRARAHKMLKSLFDVNYQAYWFGYELTKRQQDHRIIALLLTADMAESVGE